MISTKAKKLYVDCKNTDPEISILMPFHVEKFQGRNFHHAMIIGQLINKYALGQFEEDEWIEFSRENFYIQKSDKEGWTNLKSNVYRLEKKGFVETKFENGVNFIRLTNNNDEIFNAEVYKR
ncbi:hypothetical protein V7124_19475 [Neobacillus niacini]|uniref:hypothetical protein n=1 Tax=Neobacillus niacini TaxID=86668 RepID=UPI002FFE38E8